MRLIAILCVAASAACADPAGFDCTLIALPAITVEVTDAISGAYLAEGAWGLVRDGEYVDSLQPFSSGTGGVLRSFQAAHERIGVYEVSVWRDGYDPWTRTGVVVEADVCHVITVPLMAELQPSG